MVRGSRWDVMIVLQVPVVSKKEYEYICLLGNVGQCTSLMFFFMLSNAKDVRFIEVHSILLCS